MDYFINMVITKEFFASIVDHTLLKPEATASEIEQVCNEAVAAGSASVCVNGCWIPLVAERLSASGVLSCSVVGFPLGSMSKTALAFEIADVIKHGAQEIDMVLPLGLLVAGDKSNVSVYLEAAREASAGQILKVIIESSLLTEKQIIRACELSVQAGVDFVKTSTGFNPAGGATVGAVRLMRSTVGSEMGVKASGGIRTLADVERMLDAGASRLGMSSMMNILSELPDA